jgi:hypothetical protein
MGRSAIVAKLCTLLNKGINTEAEVVYLLVEIRKLLDILNNRANDYLRFSCDWVVHSKLDRRMAKRLVTNFDQLNDALNVGHPPPPHVLNEIEPLVTYAGFRMGLDNFLAGQGLSKALCNGPAWPAFLKLYGSVITDCPLTISSGTKPTTRYVSDIVVSVHEHQPTNGRFTTNWKINFHTEPAWAKVSEFNLDMTNPQLPAWSGTPPPSAPNPSIPP